MTSFPSKQSVYIAIALFPLDGSGSAVPSLQLHPVFGIGTERVPPNDAMSRFVGFGDKSWDNLKNFFQTQGFEFLFFVPKGLPAMIRVPDWAESPVSETQPQHHAQATRNNC